MSTQTAEKPASDKPGENTAGEIVVAPAKQVVANETPARLGHGQSISLGDYQSMVSHYPEPLRTNVEWLQGFFLDHCRGNKTALRAISAQIKMEKSESYFLNLMQGYNFKPRYPSGNWKQGGRAWAECEELLAALRRYAQQKEQVGKLPFVETPTYRCLSNFILAKMALSAVCKFGGITGPTGAQKSACFKYFRLLNNHGRVIHIEAPANGRLTKLQAKIAKAYHINKTGVRLRCEEEIRLQVNETRCIIIDNAQELYIASKGSDQPAFSWLRELQDDTNCTIILSFTTEFAAKTLVSGEAQGYFEQFIGRMGGIDALLTLPEYTPESDLRVIARSFGLDPGKGAMVWLTKWSRRSGRVRNVFEKLQFARECVKLDGRDCITLDDLAEADAYRPQAIGSDAGEEQDS